MDGLAVEDVHAAGDKGVGDDEGDGGEARDAHGGLRAEDAEVLEEDAQFGEAERDEVDDDGGEDVLSGGVSEGIEGLYGGLGGITLNSVAVSSGGFSQTCFPRPWRTSAPCQFSSLLGAGAKALTLACNHGEDDDENLLAHQPRLSPFQQRTCVRTSDEVMIKSSQPTPPTKTSRLYSRRATTMQATTVTMMHVTSVSLPSAATMATGEARGKQATSNQQPASEQGYIAETSTTTA